jgi:hypothetical protein
MDADSKMLSNSSSKNGLKIAGTKPKLLGIRTLRAPFSSEKNRDEEIKSREPGNVSPVQPIAPQKDKIGVRESDRYSYAMVPQARSDRATRR